MHPMWAELVQIEEGLGLTETASVPAQHRTSLLKLEHALQVTCLSSTACSETRWQGTHLLPMSIAA